MIDFREAAIAEEEEEGEDIEGLARAIPCNAAPELHTPSNASSTPKPEARSRSPSILVILHQTRLGEAKIPKVRIYRTYRCATRTKSQKEGVHNKMDISRG